MTSFVKTVTWDCGDAPLLARLHFDLRPPLGSMEAEIERLTGRGATTVERFESHVVMRDPEGNEFCVEPGTGEPRP
jgi:hypothetical protein